jgi:hypothetical protein
VKVIGEIVALVMLSLGVAIFGIGAWRLTLHVIGVEPHEVAMWRAWFRERWEPEPQPEVSTNPSGAAERAERILALIDEEPGIGRSS